MKKNIKGLLTAFVISLILFVTHLIDTTVLDNLFANSQTQYYPLYETFRKVVHNLLWIAVIVLFAITLFDFKNKKRVSLNSRAKAFLLLLAIAIATELPIWPCYTAGIHEPFWKSFHLH